MGWVGDLFGFGRSRSIKELMDEIEPKILKSQIKVLDERIYNAREAKNKLPAGRALLNRLEAARNRDAVAYNLIKSNLLPEIIKLSDDLKSIITRVNETKTQIKVPREVLEFLNIARMEFEQDARIAREEIKRKPLRRAA